MGIDLYLFVRKLYQNCEDMIIYDYDNLYFVFVDTIFLTNMGECGKVFACITCLVRMGHPIG